VKRCVQVPVLKTKKCKNLPKPRMMMIPSSAKPLELSNDRVLRGRKSFEQVKGEHHRNFQVSQKVLKMLNNIVS
jgi:hypothetical protein